MTKRFLEVKIRRVSCAAPPNSSRQRAAPPRRSFRDHNPTLSSTSTYMASLDSSPTPLLDVNLLKEIAKKDLVNALNAVRCVDSGQVSRG